MIILRNIIAVILGAVVGSAVNMGLIMISAAVIPAPPGVDATNMESLKASMHLFEPKHFLFPFLAHALGTFAGAFAAGAIAASRKMWFALGIGVLYLVGGIVNAFMLPAPTWFVVVDLAAAYMPAGYLAGRLTAKA